MTPEREQEIIAEERESIEPLDSYERERQRMELEYQNLKGV